MVYDVAIVGSGFSAIAETAHLLRLLPSSASIAIVGDDPGFDGERHTGLNSTSTA